MGDVAVAASASWGLRTPHDARAQGLIVSPFEDLDAGLALFLELPQRCGGAWLKALSQVAPVTSAQGPVAPSVALAFTATGLQAMGLDPACLASFSAPFVEGMRQVDRQRRLGDEAGVEALPGGLLWSANVPDPHPDGRARAARRTPTTVHAALLLYHRDNGSLRELDREVHKVLRRFGVRTARRIPMHLHGPDGVVREHFGFRDGVSQPIPYGEAIVAGGHRRPPDPWHAVAAGDIVIGHQDADLEPAPGPVVSEGLPGADQLPPGHAPYGARDLGLDGSYLVIRELRQDVEGFRASIRKAAAAAGRDEDWLAARVIGRTPEGDALCPGAAGTMPKVGGEPANAFGYVNTDPAGLGCPIGAHIRRANPRDSLAPKDREGPLFLYASNRHRILRRGRKFGPPYEADPKADRGLLFMAINTDIARQFEFIQQTWMLNPNFGRLHEEIDPLVGAKGAFTTPAKPVGVRVEVETFVHLVGGDYFFLPSLPAIGYLAQLP